MGCCKGTEVCEEQVCVFTAKPVGVVPVNTQVLVERLTDQEMLGSTLIHVEAASHGGPPQAVVRACGPKVDCEACGFKIGDRVLVTGTFVPTPKLGERELCLVEPHMIKAVVTVA